MDTAFFSLMACSIALAACQGSSKDTAAEEDDEPLTEQQSPDLNGDGSTNILLLGAGESIDGGRGFSPEAIALELSSILEGTSDAGLVNVLAEDTHNSKAVTIGLGGNGAEYTYTHHSHSLMQYYHWPDDAEARMQNLLGAAEHVWDYVVIAADPYIVSNLPGYFALGVNKVAATAVEGGAQPLLLMVWEQEQFAASQSAVEEHTYRTADSAAVSLPVVPAGLAWAALTDEQRDTAAEHPSPYGAYLTAAAIYTHITQRSAAESDYVIADELAESAHSTVLEAANQIHYSADHSFDSPFAGCGVSAETLTYNHTGSSSENGILGGLNWVFEQAEESLENGGNAPSTFNYGRANSNFEANKRYKINPDMFDFSFGFPMQDHGNTGDVSMLYGLDRRDSGVLNDTDLGVAMFMIDESELPQARAIPIRTLFAQMREANPSQSAYRDAWHMHRDLDKASGAYMHTLLTGNCSLGEEPSDAASAEWMTWRSHKIGCDTAWTVMTLQGESPF